MTSLVQDLQALLGPLAAGGAHYAACTVQPVPSEYIVWLRVVSTANVSLSGPSNLQNTRIQIDVFAASPERMEAIADAVRAAFKASTITNVPGSSQDTYEEPVRLFRSILEYSVWATN